MLQRLRPISSVFIPSKPAGVKVCPSLIKRSYHSTDHIGSNKIVNDKDHIESKILTRATTYIPQYGFSALAISKAITDLGYPQSLTSIFTSNNPLNHSLPYQLMLHWLKLKRQELDTFAQTQYQPFAGDGTSEFAQLTQEQRLERLINERLSYNIPIMSHLSLGLAMLVTPYNVPSALEELLALGDDFAYYSGDQSNDFAWYTKRASMCAIYVKSELYMLGDTTQGYEMTKKFVRDKVEEYEKAGQTWVDMEQWVGFNAISLINLIKSQAARG